MLTKLDCEALALALERCPYARDGEAAAYSLQMDNLKLKPWQWPPCWVEPGDRRHKQAAKLLRDMLAAGVSRWHPDPLAAIEAKRTTP